MDGSFNDDPSRMKAFKYVMPVPDKPKKVVWLSRTEHLFAGIQVLKKGGETNLHAHNHFDGFWFVLSGRARFYSEVNTVFAEVGQHEGVLVPRGVKYWFEAVGEEPLELLQVECSDTPIRSREELNADRVNFTPRVRTPASAAE